LSQIPLLDSSVLACFLQIDRELADKTRAEGCPCGGPLYSADFRRKPRGHLRSHDPDFDRRFSLCCGTDGCRTRATPPSVRFLGRRVYLGVIVVLVSAIRQGPAPWRMRVLKEHFGVDRRAVQRWRQFFEKEFRASRCFRLAQARLVGFGEPVPWSLLDKVGVFADRGTLTEAMKLFAPFSQSPTLPDPVT